METGISIDQYLHVESWNSSRVTTLDDVTPLQFMPEASNISCCSSDRDT